MKIEKPCNSKIMLKIEIDDIDNRINLVYIKFHSEYKEFNINLAVDWDSVNSRYTFTTNSSLNIEYYLHNFDNCMLHVEGDNFISELGMDLKEKYGNCKC